MDIFEALRRDHARVKGYLARLAETGESAVQTREEVFARLRAELNAHSRAEEAVFYRHLEDDRRIRDLALEDEQEHHMVDVLLDEMASMDVAEEQWTAKLGVLSEQVCHHMDEEETQLFEKARKALNGNAERLAEAFLQEKKRHL